MTESVSFCWGISTRRKVHNAPTILSFSSVARLISSHRGKEILHIPQLYNWCRFGGGRSSESGRRSETRRLHTRSLLHPLPPLPNTSRSSWDAPKKSGEGVSGQKDTETEGTTYRCTQINKSLLRGLQKTLLCRSTGLKGVQAGSHLQEDLWVYSGLSGCSLYHFNSHQ